MCIPSDLSYFNTSNGFPANDPRAPAADPAANFFKNVVVFGSFAPKRILIGSYNPSRRDVYDASRSQAAFTPFQRPRTPSSETSFFEVPSIPSSPYSAEIWIRVYKQQNYQTGKELEVDSARARRAYSWRISQIIGDFPRINSMSHSSKL